MLIVVVRVGLTVLRSCVGMGCLGWWFAWFVLRPDCLMATVVLCGLVCRGVLGVCNLWNFLICRFACCV